MELSPGIKGEAGLLVEAGQSARNQGSGELDVLATPAMIALMERAAWQSVSPFLDERTTSVGVKIEIEHVAPTPLKAEVVAYAELTKVEGRRLTFRVEAYEGNVIIGHGWHERVLVDREKFMAKVAR